MRGELRERVRYRGARPHRSYIEEEAPDHQRRRQRAVKTAGGAAPRVGFICANHGMHRFHDIVRADKAVQLTLWEDFAELMDEYGGG